MDVLGKIKCYIGLANYFNFQNPFFDGNVQKKPNIRKCMEQPWQQTRAELWDNTTHTLCNLDFIQAKAAAKMIDDLVRDFNDVLEVIPENAENIRKEKERQASLDKYIRDLIACARGKITVDEMEIPESSTPWQKEKIDAEIERINRNLIRLDRKQLTSKNMLLNWQVLQCNRSGISQPIDLWVSPLNINRLISTGFCSFAVSMHIRPGIRSHV